MSERVKTKLGDILDKIIDHRGLTPKKLGSDFVSYGIPVLSAKHIKDGQIINKNDFRYVTPEIYDLWMPEKLKKGDILLTSEAPLGEVFFLRENADYCLGQRLFGLRAKSNILDSRFFYYLVKSPYFQVQLHARATGTTAQGIRQSELVKIEIEFPPLPEQKAIAYILGTLDDKIDLNRRMNETLEEMAKAIFKSWFVDFDPVIDNALKAGNPIPDALAEKAARRRAILEKLEKEDPNLPKFPPEVTRLFPDSFENSPLGPIPKGWMVDTMDNHFRIIMGQSPPGNTYNEDGNGLPFYQGRIDFGFRFPSRRMYCTAPTRVANKSDTLITVRAPVGAINKALERCCIGRGVAAIRHITGYRSYTYYFVHSLRPFFERFEAEGTVFGSITKKDFTLIKYVMPPIELIERFESMCKPIDEMIERNECEIRTLATLRDTLLPKLISGQIRIKDAEKFVGEML